MTLDIYLTALIVSLHRQYSPRSGIEKEGDTMLYLSIAISIIGMIIYIAAIVMAFVYKKDQPTTLPLILLLVGTLLTTIGGMSGLLLICFQFS